MMLASLMGATSALCTMDLHAQVLERALATPLPSSSAHWLTSWSPLERAAGIERRPIALAAGAQVLSAPAPRIGAFWTGGLAAVLPWEIGTGRSQFTAEMTEADGSFRRPLDPASASARRLGGRGWRPLGDNAAVAGGADVLSVDLEPASFTPVIDPYTDSPHVPLDTITPDLSRTRARLQGAGGYRFGRFGVGLSAAYEAGDSRTGRTRIPRSGRIAKSAGSAGAVAEVAAIRVGAQALRARSTESVSIIERTAEALVYELIGFFEPEFREVTGGYSRRIQRDTRALGATAAGRALATSWTAGLELARAEESHGAPAGADSLADRWTVEGHTLRLALQRDVGRGFHATGWLDFRDYEGFANRHDLRGAIFRSHDRALDVRLELRRPVPDHAWGGGIAAEIASDSREWRDILAEMRYDPVATRVGAAVEVAHALTPRFAASAAYSIASHRSSATPPAFPASTPLTTAMVAPELAYYAANVTGHGITLAVSALVRSTNLVLETRYASINASDADALVGGSRSAWSVGLTIVPVIR